MVSRADFEVVRKLHSQPKSDVLLCLTMSDSVADAMALGAHVVLKQIHTSARSPAASKDPVHARADVVREGVIIERLLALPPHPNIVRYHRVLDEPKMQVIVMDYYGRGDLLACLHQQPQTRFTNHTALTLFAQIARGVHFLHTHDIAHCDLSLENLLVDDDNTIRICDFGLACSASTTSTQRIGKINYMAPEVVRGDVYDPIQADVWSLGIVLFMLLTGSPLFELAMPDDPAYICLQRLGLVGVLANWGLSNEIDNQTIALLEDMLQLDYTKRLRNVDAILDHLHF